MILMDTSMGNKPKGTRWSIEDVNAYNAKRGNAPVEKKKPNIKLPKIEKVSVEKRSIAMVLFAFEASGDITTFDQAVDFHPVRKWRFDWAIPDIKVAIEYEGLMSEKSGHTTPTGYTSDCEKYNAAALLGWTVLRYTALNYGNLGRDLTEYLKNG